MNKTETLHPVELLLLIGLVALEAVAVLAVALVALVLTITRPRPAGSPARVMPPPPAAAPAVHPLSVVAAELAELPVTTLRPMVGTRSKRAKKAELVAMVAACC
ncbi:hypothetical protein [Synechococcus sp. FACHB-909]|uniref:hypothetical protein n=1 Tax=Synechococcus sp. FACHB-909 TaxID=2692863 RepID=UPI0016831C17|nr:hypothetical protein [Synechococcus sp. FACHB-909]MBD2718113.1 hypothetical protein [Synechococcus sp. FACHB-909]